MQAGITELSSLLPLPLAASRDAIAPHETLQLNM